MDALLLAVVPLVGYLIAYRLYGRFLARRIFRLDDSRAVPSKELADGKDYVATRKGIIFGHHYTSIAGTGPIVGPALAIIWGWVPALLWVVLGSIFMGGLHDFGSLVISLRNQGKSLSDIARKYINKRVRLIFFLICFFELWIVIAVFCKVIAGVFISVGKSVFPIWMEIPIAVVLGIIVYRKKGNVALFTTLAVLAMYLTVLIGHALPPFAMPLLGDLPAEGLWTIVLLIYAAVASVLPVTTLLQPRDYINAWQLFIAMLLLLAGVAAAAARGGFHIVAPAYNPSPTGAPGIWPFLFVTIACGAISGFHALVASGTTPKQVSRESDALFVGYGSMLAEAALATLVIVAVAAGIGMYAESGTALWQSHYADWGAAKKGAVGTFITGASNMMYALGLPKTLGAVIIGVVIASFAGTTLDTATRIQRYVVSELASEIRLKPLSGRFAATAIAVISAGILAFSTGAKGTGALALWPMFGAVNQLLAALALLLVTVYLRRRSTWGWVLSAVPCLFMLVVTNHAMVINEVGFVRAGHILLSCVNGATLILAAWMAIETVVVLFKVPAVAPAPT